MPYDAEYKGHVTLTKSQIIDKLVALPNLPVIFISEFGGWGHVVDVSITTVRKCHDEQISIIVDPRLALQHLGEGSKAYENWATGQDIQVIAITG